MSALREVVAEFSIKLSGQQGLKQLDSNINSVKRNLGGAEAGLSGFGNKLREIGTAFIAAFATRQVFEFFKGQAELGEELERTSAKLGISTNMLQRWQYAATVTGGSTEGLTTSMRFLQLAISKAGTDKEVGAAFAKLGVHTKDAAGKTKDLSTVMLESADGFAKVAQQSDRIALSRQLFGKQGAEQLVLLQRGSKAVRELVESQEAANAVLGEDFIQAAKKAAIEEKKLEFSTRGLKAAVAQDLFPAFGAITNKLTGWLQGLTHLSKETTGVSSGTTLLAAAMGFKLFNSMGKLAGISRGGFLGNTMGLAKTGLYAAGIAGIALAFDDLFALMTGKKSLVGEVMDKIGGKGTSTEFVKDLTDAWNEMAGAITGVKGESSDLAEIWQQFKSALETMLVYAMHNLGKFAKVVGSLFNLMANHNAAALAEYNQAVGALGAGLLANDKTYNADAGNKGKSILSKQGLANVEKIVGKGNGRDFEESGLTPKQFAQQHGTGTGTKQVTVVQNITVKHIEDSAEAAHDAIARTNQNTLHAVRNRAPSQGGEDFVP